MGLKTTAIFFDELTTDPGSPAEGQFWYNTTDQQLKGYINGAVEVIIDKTTFDAHATSTANPHTTTLEQARTAGATLAGDVDMGGNNITNVGASGAGYNAASEQFVADQIKQKIQGLDWQESVLDKDLAVPPGVPATGDRYIVGSHSYAVDAVNPTTEVVEVVGDITSELSATETFKIRGSTGNDGTYTVSSIVFNSPNTEITVNEDLTSAVADGQVVFAEDAWNAKVNQIAEWNGSAWEFSVPDEGFATIVEDEGTKGVAYLYNEVADAWGAFGEAIDHGALIGLGDDDHTQYLLVSGARAMGGDLDMGANDITNVGNVDGVDVSDHSARHDPGGTDALTTAAPGATGVATASSEGSAASFARSDHAHQSNTAPADVTKAAAAIGTSGEPARADHKHDVSTAAPVAVGTANAEGAATSLARSNHVHDHGAQTTEGHHSLVTATNHGFQPRSNRNAAVDPTVNDDNTLGYGVGSYWANVSAGRAFFCLGAATGSAVWVQTGATGLVSALIHKAGRVLAASFAGNPKKATVTFAAAFADANYAAVVTAVTTNNKQFALSVESQVAGSFTINAGANNIADLTQVNWVAMKDGESS